MRRTALSILILLAAVFLQPAHAQNSGSLTSKAASVSPICRATPANANEWLIRRTTSTR